MPRRASPALKAWLASCRELGYLQKGEGFKPLPKKGSAAYKEIRALYESKIAKNK